MRARKLQRFAQRKRKSKAMHQAEGKRRHPAPMQAGADNIGQGHPDNRSGDQGLDKWRKPQPLRPQAQGCSNQRDRVRDREGRGHHHHGAQMLSKAPWRAQRDHQAGQEQQVVGAFKDVPHALLHKAPGGLVPAWVKVHEAGVAVQFVGALDAVVGYKTQRHRHAQPESRKARVDGEARLRRSNRHLQLHVEHLLVPVELLAWRNASSGQVGQGLGIGGERAIRGQRDA